MAWGSLDGGVAVLLYAPGIAKIPLGKNRIEIISETDYPASGRVSLTINPEHPASIPLVLRVLAWTRNYAASINGKKFRGEPGGYLRVDRTWNPGDQVEIDIDMTVSVLDGGPSYPGHVAIRRGPEVLTLERDLNPRADFLHLASPIEPQHLSEISEPLSTGWLNTRVYTTGGLLRIRTQNSPKLSSLEEKLLLVPFSAAGNHRVWMPTADVTLQEPIPVTLFGFESRSKSNNELGSICDGKTDTCRSTKRGVPHSGERFAVEMPHPETIRRVVYHHGETTAEGGWFDASAGKPRIQVLRPGHTERETVANVDGYPASTNSNPAGLDTGHGFVIDLERPVRALGVRIIGKPAGTYITCSELSAYDR
jgi:uncharacterized protein